MHFKGLDLNLLLALDVLLSERNVTRAAERLHISQPGMSSALQKLRQHFSDELLERVGRKFELTPRAKLMVGPVKDILFDIQVLTEGPDEFDPTAAQRVFRISASTFCCELLATPVILHLEKMAPQISCQFDDLQGDSFTRLVEGQFDFAITISQRLHAEPMSSDISLSAVDIFSDELVLVVARKNRAVGDTISFDELCTLPYVETRFGNGLATLGEQVWRRQPKPPKVRAWLPNFQLTLDAVNRTDMIAMVPKHLVGMNAGLYDIRTLPVPFAIPRLEEKLFWHPRNDRDAGHRWFRESLQSVAKKCGLTNDPV